MDSSAKGKRPVRRVRRRGGRSRPVSQTPSGGQAEEAAGDPFAAVAQGEARPSATERKICVYTGWITGATYYFHRDLKYPVVVRRIDQ